MERRGSGIKRVTFEDPDTGQKRDIVTATFSKAQLIIGTLVTLVTLLTAFGGLFKGLADYQWEKFIKQQAEQESSALNVHLENYVEEHIGEIVQAVVNDDLEYIEREIRDLRSSQWRSTKDCREISGHLAPEDFERSDP
jgi:hypothetical protein